MRTAAFALAVLVAAHEPVQEHQHGGKLGTVTFENSCAPSVQSDFTHGLAQLHSFEFGPAIDAFLKAAAADPSCGIALWGAALAQWGNPFSPGIKPPAQVQSAHATVTRASNAGAKTERERDFIAALGALYDQFGTVDQRTRQRAYRDAMARVAARYPGDPEATAFYALALAAAADPADKSYADQLKAGAMLEKLWRVHPEHPGLAHYIIHSYDAPALAPLAVAAARRYARIAPDAPHALHMPSHTFTRLGYWQDSIDTNILSAAAARQVKSTFEELHATDYQVYAYLQSGQDAAARKLVDLAAGLLGASETRAGAAPPTAGAFALAAIPARYALERGDWAAAAKLEPRATSVGYADALTWFARALGAARTGEIATARTAVAELQKAVDRLTAEREAYWAEQVTIQKIAASAWLALAEGRQADALASMREAAEREDRTEKAAVTPGPLAPARELLGEMLLQVKQPKAALAEFQKVMTKEPNRFRAVAGAAAAASRSGNAALARKLNAELLKICPRGDTPGRPELAAARAGQ
jgi:tetratricopeptide (TPR) repeat protein